MFIKRKWARMGSVLKLYVRISAILLIAVVVLAFNLWRNKKNRLFELTTTLDKRIQDRIPGHENIRSLERPKIQPQSSVKSESYSTRNLLPSYDNSLDNSRNDQPLQNTRVQQKLIIPKKVEESQTTNVLILSFTRSGGAFLGQLLNNINPDTFYSIDPLPMAVSNQVRPHNLNSE